MDALHEFIPTIEVRDDHGNSFSYQSLIVPRVGEELFCGDEKDNNKMVKVTDVKHDIVEGRVVKICKKVFIDAEVIKPSKY